MATHSSILAWEISWTVAKSRTQLSTHAHTQKLGNQKQRKKEFSLFLPFHNFEFHPMHMYYLFQKFNMIFKYIRIKKCETSSREISPLKWSQEARRGRSQAGPGTQIKELSITDLKRRTIRNTSSVRGHSRRDVHAVLGKELTTPATQPKRDCHHASLMDSHSKHPFPTSFLSIK